MTLNNALCFIAVTQIFNSALQSRFSNESVKLQASFEIQEAIYPTFVDYFMPILVEALGAPISSSSPIQSSLTNELFQ